MPLTYSANELRTHAFAKCVHLRVPQQVITLGEAPTSATMCKLMEQLTFADIRPIAARELEDLAASYSSNAKALEAFCIRKVTDGHSRDEAQHAET